MDKLDNLEKNQEAPKPEDAKVVLSDEKKSEDTNSPFILKPTDYNLDLGEATKRVRLQELQDKELKEKNKKINLSNEKIKSSFKDLDSLFTVTNEIKSTPPSMGIYGFSPVVPKETTTKETRQLDITEIDPTRASQIVGKLGQIETEVKSFGDEAWKNFTKQNPWFDQIKNGLTGDNLKKNEARLKLKEESSTVLGALSNFPGIGSLIPKTEAQKILGTPDPTVDFFKDIAAGTSKLVYGTVPSFFRQAVSLGQYAVSGDKKAFDKNLEIIKQQQNIIEKGFDEFYGTTPSNLSFEDVKNDLNQGKSVSAGIRFFSQLPEGVSTQAPQIIAFGFTGLLTQEMGKLGRIGGSYLTAFTQHFNENLNRQLDEKKPDTNPWKAMISAAINAATDSLSYEVIFGDVFSKGKKGLTFAEISKIKDKSTMGLYLKEASAYAGTEIPTEVFQQLTSRWQANLPLWDTEAMKEYRDTAYAVSTSFPLGLGGATTEKTQAKNFIESITNLKDVEINANNIIANINELPDEMLQQMQVPEAGLENLKIPKFNLSQSVFSGTSLSDEQVKEKLDNNEKNIKSGNYYKQNNTASLSLKSILNSKDVSDVYKKIIISQIARGNVLLVSNLNDLPKDVVDNINNASWLKNALGFNYRFGGKKIILADNIWNSVVQKYQNSGKEFKLSDVENAFFQEAEKTIIHESTHSALASYMGNYRGVLDKIANMMKSPNGSSVIDNNSFDNLNRLISENFISGDMDVYLDIYNITKDIENNHKEIQNYFNQPNFDNISQFVGGSLELNNKLQANQKKLIRLIDKQNITQQQKDIINQAFKVYSEENYFNKFSERFSDNQVDINGKALWRSAFDIFPQNAEIYKEDPGYFADEIAAYAVEINPEAIREEVESLFRTSETVKNFSRKLNTVDKNKIFKSFLLNRRLSSKTFTQASRTSIKLTSTGEIMYPGTSEVNTLKDLQRLTAIDLLRLDSPGPTNFADAARANPTRDLINKDIDNLNSGGKNTDTSYIPSINSDTSGNEYWAEAGFVGEGTLENLSKDIENLTNLFISAQPTSEIELDYDSVNEQIAKAQEEFSSVFPRFVEQTGIVPGSWLINKETGEVSRFVGIHKTGVAKDDYTAIVLKQKKNFDVDTNGFIVFNVPSNLGLQELDKFVPLTGTQIEFYISEENNKLLKELTSNGEKLGIDTVYFTEEQIKDIFRKHIPNFDGMGISSELSKSSVWFKNILKGISFTRKSDKESGITQTVATKWLGRKYSEKIVNIYATETREAKFKKLKDQQIVPWQESILSLMNSLTGENLIDTSKEMTKTTYAMYKTNRVIDDLISKTKESLNMNRQSEYDNRLKEVPIGMKDGEWRNLVASQTGAFEEIKEDEKYKQLLNKNVLIFLGENGFSQEEIDEFQNSLKNNPDIEFKDALSTFLMGHYAIEAATWSGDMDDWYKETYETTKSKILEQIESSKKKIEEIRKKTMPASWMAFDSLAKDALGDIKPGLIERKESINKNQKELVDKIIALNNKSNKTAEDISNIASLTNTHIANQYELEQIDSILSGSIDFLAANPVVGEFTNEKGVFGNPIPEKLSALGFAFGEVINAAKNEKLKLTIPNIDRIDQEIIPQLTKELEEAEENYAMAKSTFAESRSEIHLSTAENYKNSINEIKVKLLDYETIKKQENKLKEKYLDEIKQFNKEFTDEEWRVWRIENGLSRYMSYIAKISYLKLYNGPKTDAAYNSKLFVDYQTAAGETESSTEQTVENFIGSVLTTEDKDIIGWENLGRILKQKGINILFKRLMDSNKNSEPRLQVFKLSMEPIVRSIEKQLQFRQENGPNSFIPYYEKNPKQYIRDAKLYALYKTINQYQSPETKKILEVTAERKVKNSENNSIVKYEESKTIEVSDSEFRKMVAQGNKVKGKYRLIGKNNNNNYTVSVKNQRDVLTWATKAEKQGHQIATRFLRALTPSESKNIKSLEDKIQEIYSKREFVRTVGEAYIKNGNRIVSFDTTKLDAQLFQLSKALEDIKSKRDFEWDWDWSIGEKQIFYNLLSENYQEVGIDLDIIHKKRIVSDGIIDFRSKINHAINYFSNILEYEQPAIAKTFNKLMTTISDSGIQDATLESVPVELIREWMLSVPKITFDESGVTNRSKLEFTESDYIDYVKYNELLQDRKRALTRMFREHYAKQVNPEYQGRYSPEVTTRYMSMPIEKLWEDSSLLPRRTEEDPLALTPIQPPSPSAFEPEGPVDPSKRIKNLRLLIAKAVGFITLGGISIEAITSGARVQSGKTIGEALIDRLPFIGAAIGAYYLIKGDPKIIQSYVKNISKQSQKYKGPFAGRTRFISRTILDKKFGFSEATRLNLIKFQEQWGTITQQLIQTTNQLQYELEQHCHIGNDLNAGIDTAKSLNYVRLLTTFFDPVDTILNSDPSVGPDREKLLSPFALEIFGSEKFTLAREALKKDLALEFEKLSQLSSEDAAVQLEIDKQKSAIDKQYRRWFGYTEEEKSLAINNYANDLIKLVGNPAYITGFPTKKKFSFLSKDADLNSIAIDIRKELIIREQIKAFNQLPIEVQPYAKEIKNIITNISNQILFFSEQKIINLDSIKDSVAGDVVKQDVAREIRLKLGEYLPIVYEAFDSHSSWKEQPDFQLKKEQFRIALLKNYENIVKYQISKLIANQKVGVKIWGTRKVSNILAQKEEMLSVINAWEKQNPVLAQQLNNYLTQVMDELEMHETDKMIKKKGPQTVEGLFAARKEALALVIKFKYANVQRISFNKFVKITNEIEGSDYIKFKETNASESYVPQVIRKAIFEQRNMKLLDAYQKYLGKLDNPLERASVGSVKQIQFLSSISYQQALRGFLISEGFASTDASTDFSETFTSDEEAKSEAVRKLRQLQLISGLHFTPYGKQLTLSWLEDESNANWYTKGIGIAKVVQVIFNTATWERQIISDGTAAIGFGGTNLYKSELWSVNWKLQKAYRYGTPVIYDKVFMEQFAKLVSPELLEKYTDKEKNETPEEALKKIIKQVMAAGIFEENVLAKDVLTNLGTNQPVFSLLAMGGKINRAKEFYKNLVNGTFTRDEFQKALKHGQYANRSSIKSAVSAASYFFGTTNNLGRFSVYLSHLNGLAKSPTFTVAEASKLAYALTHRVVPRFENYPELIKLASRYGIFSPYIFFEWMGARGLINQVKTISMLNDSKEFAKWIGREVTPAEMEFTKGHSKKLTLKLLLGIGLNVLFLYSVFADDDDDELTDENKNSMRDLFMGYMGGKPLGVKVDKVQNQLIVRNNEYMAYFAPFILLPASTIKIAMELYKEIKEDGPFDYDLSASSGAIRKLEDIMRSKSAQTFLNPIFKGLSVLTTGRDPASGKLVDERDSTMIERLPEAITATASGLVPPDVRRINKMQEGRYTPGDWLQIALLGSTVERIPIDKFYSRVFYGPSQGLKDVIFNFGKYVSEINEGEKIDFHVNKYNKEYITQRNTLAILFDNWKKSGLQTPIAFVDQLTGGQGTLKTPLVNDSFIQVSMLYGNREMLSIIGDIDTNIAGDKDNNVSVFAREMYLKEMPPSTVIDTVVNKTSTFFVDAFVEGNIGQRKLMKNGKEETYYYWDNQSFNPKKKQEMVIHFNEALPYLYASMMVNKLVDSASRRSNILEQSVDGVNQYLTPKSSSLSNVLQDAKTKYLENGGRKQFINFATEPEQDIQDAFRIEYEMKKFIDSGKSLKAQMFLDNNGNFIFTGEEKDRAIVEQTLQHLLLKTFVTNSKDKTRGRFGFESFSNMKNAKIPFFDINKFPKRNTVDVFYDVDGNALPSPKTNDLLTKIVQGRLDRVVKSERIVTEERESLGEWKPDEDN